ncbi:MAG: hypothetical protein WCD89_02845 [Anaerocolumna sp.]
MKIVVINASTSFFDLLMPVGGRDSTDMNKSKKLRNRVWAYGDMQSVDICFGEPAIQRFYYVEGEMAA